MFVYVNRLLLIVLSVLASIILNILAVDPLIRLFAVMSDAVYMINRVSFALLFYLVLNILFFKAEYTKKNLINRLFLIYALFLIGLLFGRFYEYKTIASRFNFHSFLPLWLSHLDHPLVLLYIFGNLVICIPLGMYLRCYKNFIFSFLYCILIIALAETLQAVTGLGYFDTDDILLNGLSGLIGILLAGLKINKNK